MGCRILVGREGESREQAVLFDSVTGWAFGPLFDDTGHATAYASAECFQNWLGDDARSIPSHQLGAVHERWMQETETGGEDDADCSLCDGSGDQR